MDPNVLLEELRELLVEHDEWWLGAHLDPKSHGPAAAYALEMAEKIRYLDAWLCDGGFLPDDWKAKAVND